MSSINDCNLILDPKFKKNPSYQHNKKVETGTKNGDIFFIGIEKISQKLWFGAHNNYHIKIKREISSKARCQDFNRSELM